MNRYEYGYMRKVAAIQKRATLYNAMKGILRIKLAETTFDPASVGLNEAQIRSYNAFTPDEPGTWELGGGAIKRELTALPGKLNDPKGRNIKLHGFAPNSSGIRSALGMKDDDAMLFRYAHGDVSPAENLLAGKDVSSITGRVYQDLLDKGYSAKELAGLKDTASILGVTGRDVANDKTIAPFGIWKTDGVIDKDKSGTIYIDESGNIVDRSLGIQRGRKIGAIGGAAGGAALGGLAGYGASRGLGLYGENSNTAKRMLGHLLTAGGAVGGGIGGYYGGRALGERIGGWIDPQKGNAIKVYSSH